MLHRVLLSINKFSNCCRKVMFQSRKVKTFNKGGRPSSLKQTIDTSKGPIEYMVADFLKAIGERPIVYNDAIDTQSLAQREILWLEIGASLDQRFAQLPLAEQKIILTKRLKRSWAHHKALMLRSVHMKQSGDPKFRPYTFRKEMDFFIKFNNIDRADTILADEDDKPEISVKENSIGPSPERRNAAHTTETASTNGRFSAHNDTNSNDAELSTSQVSETFSNTSSLYNGERLCHRSNNKNCTSVKERAKQIQNRSMLQDPETTTFFCQTTANGSIDLTEADCEKETNSEPPFIQIHAVHSARDDGADQAFFESIMPSLRQIEEVHKLDFKIDVLQLLKKYQN